MEVRLSIVTSNLNNRNGLQATLDSISRQVTMEKVEYIVIDGGSSDGSLELLSRYKSIIDILISEPDDGIADAFNKGVKNSKGDFIYFLNSGDVFACENCTAKIIPRLSSSDYLYLGNISIKNYRNNEDVFVNTSTMNWSKQIFRNYIPHQALFISRSLFERYGYYDSSFFLGMDYQWSLRLYKKVPIVHLPYLVAQMDSTGVSMKRYVETFRMYHKARVSLGICSSFWSYLILVYYTVRRWVANRVYKERE